MSKIIYLKGAFVLLLGLIIPAVVYAPDQIFKLYSSASSFNKLGKPQFTYLTVRLNEKGQILDYKTESKVNLTLDPASNYTAYKLKTADNKKLEVISAKTENNVLEEFAPTVGGRSKLAAGEVISRKVLTFRIPANEANYELVTSDNKLIGNVSAKPAVSGLNFKSLVGLADGLPAHTYLYRNTDNRPQETTVDFIIFPVSYHSSSSPQYFADAEGAKNNLLNGSFFRDNKGKFNVIRIDDMSWGNSADCVAFMGVPCVNQKLISEQNTALKGDIKILLYNNSLYSAYANLGNEVNISRPAAPSTTLIHELGHAFGRMWDEYVGYPDAGPYSYANCKGSCSEFDPQYLEACTQGCWYGRNYRSSITSIMNNGAVPEFSRLGYYYMQLRMNELTGTPADDTTNPTVVVTKPASNETVSGVYTIEVHAEDNVGVTSLNILLDGAILKTCGAVTACTHQLDTKSLANGNHTVKVEAKDAKNNTGSVTTVFVVNNVVQDTNPPTANINSPLNGAVVSGDVSIVVSASDDVGLSSLSVLIDNTVVKQCGAVTACSYAFDSQTYSNGEHTIGVDAYDLSNNKGSSSINLSIDNAVAPPPPVVDTTPPTVAISSPANGATVSGVSQIDISASDNVGVVTLNISIDNVVASNCGAVTSSCSHLWDTKTYSNGSHSIKAEAYDAANNKSTQTISVTINNETIPPPPPPQDTTPPGVTISSPTNGSTISGSVLINASASDNVGVSALDILIDGTVIRNCGAVTSCFRGLDTTSYTNGNHTITAKAYDAAGNNNTYSVSVTINNEVAPPPPPPTPSDPVEIANMSDGDTVYGVPDPSYGPGTYIVGVSFDVNVNSTDYMLVGQQEGGTGNFTTPCPSDCARTAPFTASLGGHISNSVNGWYNIYVRVFSGGTYHDSDTIRVKLLPPVQGLSDEKPVKRVLDQIFKKLYNSIQYILII